MAARACKRFTQWLGVATIGALPIVLGLAPIGLAPTALAQTIPQQLEQPDPLEVPIGTEANTPVEQPSTSARRLIPRPPLPKSMAFRIATWNLAASKPGEAPVSQGQSKKPAKQWRHTFGAERKTAQWRKLGQSSFAADIVALQGLAGRRTISRMFNARYYHIVISRQLLSQWTTTSGAFTVFRDNAPPTTALIFRRRRGVRIAGFRHFLPKSNKQQTEQQPAAITAIRLRVYRKLLWVASADIPIDCTADMSNNKCKPYQPVLRAFIDWAGKQISRQNAQLLLLGQWPEATKDRLAEVGLELHHSATTHTECMPKPSAIQLLAPASVKRDAATLAGQGTAKSNPCVAIADLTMSLVPR